MVRYIVRLVVLVDLMISMIWRVLPTTENSTIMMLRAFLNNKLQNKTKPMTSILLKNCYYYRAMMRHGIDKVPRITGFSWAALYSEGGRKIWAAAAEHLA